MKAVVYSEPREFRVLEVPDPIPGPREVRIRIELAGVCGTDLHIDEGTFIAQFPLVPGHEPVGVIDAIGAEVRQFTVGQRVVATGVGGCQVCDNCRRGRALLCRDLTALGVTGPGAFAEFMVVPERWCFDAGTLTAEQAVFAEPSACAVHGVDRLGLPAGSRALVLGAGPTGLVLAQLLARGNASQVVVAAPSAHKLDLARRFGIDRTVQIGRDGSGHEAIRSIAPGGFDAVVDATGAAGATQLAIDHLRDGGTLLIYGVTNPEDRIRISPFDVYRRELTITGSFAQIDSFPAALNAIEAGRVRTDGLISHEFTLDRYGDALAALRSDPTVHKVVIRP